MSKPRIFIGSSVEGLDVAYAAQENLEHDLEVTVWSQGVFEPSHYTLEDLEAELDNSDFAMMIFTPDDIALIRNEEHRVVRDNVLFELGLFMGRLHRERCFIALPKDAEDFHLPSDLLGFTPVRYEPNRTDGNLVAALGSGCNRIRKAVQRLGQFVPAPSPDEVQDSLLSDENDIIATIQGWMGSRASNLNSRAIKFSEVDRELGLVRGSAKQHIETAARRWNYVPDRRGEQTIIFKDAR